jgi:hypothetical protein
VQDEEESHRLTKFADLVIWNVSALNVYIYTSLLSGFRGREEDVIVDGYTVLSDNFNRDKIAFTGMQTFSLRQSLDDFWELF